MSIVLFANNAISSLASPISDSDTVLALQPGTGALFPSPATGQFFAITLNDALTGNFYEICYCTARSVDTLTVVRAREGTTARAWIAGDVAANLLTAGTTAQFQQLGNAYQVDTGTADNYVVALTPALASYTQSFPFLVRLINGNTGASVINFGPGNVDLTRDDGTDLQDGDIGDDSVVQGVYDVGLNKALISSVLYSQFGALGRLGVGINLFSDGTNLNASGASVNLTSATIPNLGATASLWVALTGSITVTGFGTAAEGVYRYVTWPGTVAAVNSSGLVLLGGVNRTPPARCTSLMRSSGGGIWVEKFAQNADGTPIFTGSGGTVLLATLTASNSAFLVDTTSLTAAYSYYEIVLRNVIPATASALLGLLVSTDGGTSYKTTNYSCAGTAYSPTNGPTNPTSATSILLGPNVNVSNAVLNGGMSGVVTVERPSGAASLKTWQSHISTVDTTGNTVNVVSTGVYGSANSDAAAINAIKFIESTGNILSGVIEIYGRT